MFRNNFFVICLLVAGGSSLISAHIQPMISTDASILFPDDAPAKIVSTVTSPTTRATTLTTASITPTTPDKTTGAITTLTPNIEPPIGKWNTSCILIQMATQLNFTYETVDNKTTRAIYNIPATAIVHDASCESNNTQDIVLKWGPSDAMHSIGIYFERNNTNINVQLIIVNFPLTAEEFPNAKANQSAQLIYRGDIFEAPSNMSYHCTRPQYFNVTETISDLTVIGTIRLSDVQMEAFRHDNSTIFSSTHDCESSDNSSNIPFFVGLALVIFIVCVLVTFFYARYHVNRDYMSF